MTPNVVELPEITIEGRTDYDSSVEYQDGGVETYYKDGSSVYTAPDGSEMYNYEIVGDATAARNGQCKEQADDWKESCQISADAYCSTGGGFIGDAIGEIPVPGAGTFGGVIGNTAAYKCKKELIPACTTKARKMSSECDEKYPIER